MFGRKHKTYVHLMLAQHIQQMDALYTGRMVGKKGNTPALQQGEVDVHPFIATHDTIRLRMTEGR